MGVGKGDVVGTVDGLAVLKTSISGNASVGTTVGELVGAGVNTLAEARFENTILPELARVACA